MRRPFQLALLVVGVLAAAAYLAPGQGRSGDARDRSLPTAAGMALKRGLEDAVERRGPSILWGDRLLRIASSCERAHGHQVVTCRVRFDRYSNPDRWCLATYRVVVPDRSITSAGSEPAC